MTLEERLRQANLLSKVGHPRRAQALLEGIEIPAGSRADAWHQLVLARSAILRADFAAHARHTEAMAQIAEAGGWEELQIYAELHGVHVALQEGQDGDARRRCTALVTQVASLADDELTAAVHARNADLCFAEGNLGDCERSWDVVWELGQPHEKRTACVGHGLVARARGDLTKSFEWVLAGLAIEVDAPLAEAHLRRNLATLHSVSGRPVEAEAALESARALYEAAEALIDLQRAVNELGEIARQAGQLERAEALYEQAASMPARPDTLQVARLNLGLVRLALGREDEALRCVEDITTRYLGIYVTAIKAVVDARRGRSRRFGQALAAIEDHVAAGQGDSDLAWCLEESARAGVGRGATRAARAAAIARRIWTAHGDGDARGRCGQLLEKLADQGASVPVGPFELVRPLGSGGMGEVWEARHARERVRVAIKVLHGSEAQTRTARRAFGSEIRAVARMGHPHIVRVFDHGQLGEAAEIMSAGSLVAGSPYLVMELGRGGSLVPWCGRLSWGMCRRILVDLLDALAHAHARGLIHRDLKPGNVLMHHEDNLSPGIRLTDFGLARALDDPERVRVAGTPAYMAPEQLLARAFDFGPWTDLYAVGCLAWALLTGRPPFTGSFEEVRGAHLRQPLPPLDAKVPVPEGVEPWLRALLAKDPRGRFPCAADAARALPELGEASEPISFADVTLSPQTASETFQMDLELGDDEPVLFDDKTEELPRSMPPVPASWRRDEPDPLPPSLLGVGLQLFRLRDFGVVGREEVRDRLWRGLQEVLGSAIVLRGPAGVGKTRLATWIRHRAVEVGAAIAIERRCHAELSLDGLRSEIAACTRRVVVVLDEADQSVEALAWARAIVRDPPEVPVLVVLTLRDEDTDEDVAAALERLRGTARVEEIEVGPLDGLSMSRLIEGLLGLETGVGARIASHSGGNPQFAVELVGDLVERGVLVPTAEGFALAPGGRLELPEALHEVWSARVESFLPSLPVGADEALEIAAVLGRDVDRLELAQVCAEAARLLPDGLGERLSAAGLARRTEAGFRFSQSMLRRCLLRRADHGGRLAAWHAACARVVSEEEPLRLGTHLAGAGDVQAAIPLLLRAAADPGRPSALQVTAEVDELLDRLGVPEHDPLRGAALRHRGEALLERSRYAEAIRVSDRVLAQRDREGWAYFGAKALACRGRACRATGRYAEASEALEEAIEGFEALGDLAAAAHSLHGLALVDKIQGRLEQAAERVEKAREQLVAVGGSPRSVGSAWMSCGSVAGVSGDLEYAEQCIDKALRMFIDAGLHMESATARAALAEMYRLQGDLDRAEAEFEEAWRILRRAGLGRALVVRLNLGLLYSQRGNYVQARDTLLEVQERVRHQRRRGLEAVCAGLIVPCSVALGRLEEADAQLRLATDVLEELGVGEYDVAEACERAAAVSEGDLRERCLALAESQYLAIGRQEDAERVRASRADVDR